METTKQRMSGRKATDWGNMGFDWNEEYGNTRNARGKRYKHVKAHRAAYSKSFRLANKVDINDVSVGGEWS